MLHVLHKLHYDPTVRSCHTFDGIFEINFHFANNTDNLKKKKYSKMTGIFCSKSHFNSIGSLEVTQI